MHFTLALLMLGSQAFAADCNFPNRPDFDPGSLARDFGVLMGALGQVTGNARTYHAGDALYQAGARASDPSAARSAPPVPLDIPLKYCEAVADDGFENTYYNITTHSYRREVIKPDANGGFLRLLFEKAPNETKPNPKAKELERFVFREDQGAATGSMIINGTNYPVRSSVARNYLKAYNQCRDAAARAKLEGYAAAVSGKFNGGCKDVWDKPAVPAGAAAAPRPPANQPD